MKASPGRVGHESQHVAAVELGCDGRVILVAPAGIDALDAPRVADGGGLQCVEVPASRVVERVSPVLQQPQVLLGQRDVRHDQPHAGEVDVDEILVV